jgi:hypothetical protein
MKKTTNPYCPVNGCRTKAPHADDDVVKGLIATFAPPEKMTLWAQTAMAELTESICRDLEAKKVFAWLSRLRQPEELYIRILYALFIATEEELHDILSGDMPNGISTMYQKVNELVFEGRGLLQTSRPGLMSGSFRPIDTLNDGAHTSFRAFMTAIGLARNPQYLPPAENYCKHLQTYCRYLNYMHETFTAGKSKEEVLAGVISLHRPRANS